MNKEKIFMTLFGILTLFFPALIIFGYGNLTKLIWVDYIGCAFSVSLSLILIKVGWGIGD